MFTVRENVLSPTRIREFIEREGSAEGASQFIVESLEAGGKDDLKPSQFSFRALAEGFLGSEYVHRLQYGGSIRLSEAPEPVAMASMLNTMGGLIRASFREGYNRPGYISDQLLTVVPTTRRTERLALFSESSKPRTNILEGQDIPTLQFGDRWTDTPSTTKQGGAIGITREVIIEDRGGEVLRWARDILARTIRDELEEKRLRVILGVDNNYNDSGTALNTYLTTGAWVNSRTSADLVDYSSVDAAEQLLYAMNEPASGRPIGVMPDTIIVSPARAHAALSATSPAIRRVTSTATIEQEYANPLAGRYAGRVFSSPWVRRITGADNIWFLGEPRRAFAYMENWSVGIRDGGAREDNETLATFYCTERGSCAVVEPRFMVRNAG